MKGISTIIATIIFVIITIGLVSTAYLFIGGIITGMTSKVISIIDVKANRIIIRNDGTDTIPSGDIKIFVNGEQADILNPQDIEPQHIAVLKFFPPELEMKSATISVMGASNVLSYTSDIMPHEFKVTPNTIGLWHFDSVNATNHTLDETSYHNDGQLMNDTFSCFNEPWCIQLVPGKFGSALYFNRSHDHVEIPDSNVFDFGTSDGFTIAMWAKTDIHDTSNNIYYLFRRYPGAAIRISTRYGYFQLNDYNSLRDSGGTYTRFGGGGYLQVGVWYHVAVVRDVAADQVLFYINGDLKDSKTDNTCPTCNYISDDPITIGSSWNGTIDEVVIFDRALSQVEILDSIYG